ncbi:MAG: hypothetical protein ACJ8H8_07725 [Geminicoccaceae bacterium]
MPPAAAFGPPAVAGCRDGSRDTLALAHATGDDAGPGAGLGGLLDLPIVLVRHPLDHSARGSAARRTRDALPRHRFGRCRHSGGLARVVAGLRRCLGLAGGSILIQLRWGLAGIRVDHCLGP